MPAPLLVKFEQEIEREIERDQRLLESSNGIDHDGDIEDEEEADEDSDVTVGHQSLIEYGPLPQVITNDLKSLDEMVRELVERCTCPTQFPMIRVSEGKYRIGDTKVLIFVRILRSHVMVRVGGGWDTLAHYLDKHDPCRCRSGHRQALSSRLTVKQPGSGSDLNMHVHYERTTASPPRTRRSSASSVGSASPYRPPTSSGYESMESAGSEASDEGRQRRQTSGKVSVRSDTDPEEATERADSRMTQVSTSDCSTLSSDEPRSPTLTTPPKDANGNPPHPPRKNTRIPCLDSPRASAKTIRSRSPAVSDIITPSPTSTLSRRKTSESTSGKQIPAKMTRSRSASGEAAFFGGGDTPVRKSTRTSLAGKNTWSSGRGRDRAALAGDTYSPYLANRKYGVHSASATPPMCRTPPPFKKYSAPSTPSRHPLYRQQHQPPPAPLYLNQLANDMSWAQGDTDFLHQVEEVLVKLQSQVHSKLSAEGRPIPPDIASDDFTSTWVNNHGGSPTPHSLNTPTKQPLRKVTPTPRRDPQGNNSTTKIPVPTFFRVETCP